MKHIKLFENFINEAKTVTINIPDDEYEGFTGDDIKKIKKLPASGKVILTGDGVEDFATGMYGELDSSPDNTYSRDDILNWLETL